MRSGVRRRAGGVWVLVGLTVAGARADDVAAGLHVKRLSDGSIVIASPVEGETVVLSLAKGGARVARGSVVCELDPTPVQRSLDIQVLAVRRAEAALASARLSREAAELAVAECDATGRQEVQAFRDAVVVATGEVELARALLEEATSRKDGEPELAAARRGVRTAESGLAEAKTRLSGFETTTLPARRKDAESALSSARAVEKTREVDRATAAASVTRLRVQLADCRILAPIAGTLLYVRPPGSVGEGRPVLIRRGVAVHGGQPLIRIVPDAPAPGPTPPPPPPQAG